MPANVQNISTFIHTRRPLWQFIVEDNLLRVLCHQFVVDWDIVEQVQNTFKVKVRDVLSHASIGIVITMTLPGGE